MKIVRIEFDRIYDSVKPTHGNYHRDCAYDAADVYVRKFLEAPSQLEPKTLDVERATRWLVENHPRQECRHLAELLHYYSLSVTETK